ncbi:MAG: potassium channel family protein [Methanosarcinales archaeon]
MILLLRLLRKHLLNILSKRIPRIIMLVIVIIIYGTAGFHFLEGQTWTISFYWTIITMSTVGYGDYSPKTPIGMYFAISVLIFGIGSFAAAIETIIASLVEREHNRLMGLIRVKKTGHIVVCGWSESTRECVAETDEKDIIYLIDTDEKVRKEAISRNIHFINGDPTRIEDLKKANIEKAKAVIVDLPTDSETIHCILGIRKLSEKVRIIAEAERHENIEQIKLAGANQVLSPFVLSGKLMYQSIDMGYEAMFVQEVLTSESGSKMQEISVKENSPICGKTIEQADIHKNTGVILVGIGRDHKLIVDPSRKFKIESGDVLLCVGNDKEFKELEKLVIMEK